MLPSEVALAAQFGAWSHAMASSFQGAWLKSSVGGGSGFSSKTLNDLHYWFMK